MNIVDLTLEQATGMTRDPLNYRAKFGIAECFEDRFFCPCCRMPTLKEPMVFADCMLCWWESDPDGVLHSDDARPCNKVSLTDAISNFLRLDTNFEPADNPYLAELLNSDIRRELTDYTKRVRAGDIVLDMKLLPEKLDMADKDYLKRYCEKDGIT